MERAWSAKPRTRVHKHTMVGANFVPDVLLFGVVGLVHTLAAVGAVYVISTIVFLALLRVAVINQFTAFDRLHTMGFVVIEPQTLTVRAATYRPVP